MSTSITCPHCHNTFEATDALRNDVKKELNAEVEKWRKEKEAEFSRREAAQSAAVGELQKQKAELLRQQEQAEMELKKRVDIARKEQEVAIQKELSEKLKLQFDSKMKSLDEARKESENHLRIAREQEVQSMKQLRDLRDRQEKMELEKQKEIMEMRQKMAVEIKHQEDERYKLREQEHTLRRMELEKQLEDQKRLAEEAVRKAQQGSMQLQGEVQELALEDSLRKAFPFDTITEVPKGVRGADCILTVRNERGETCGSIIFESKRTKDFGGDWIDKLKTNMASCGADIAVIVSQALPRDFDRFGEHRGVYVCGFLEVKSLVGVLRQAIIKIYDARKSQENKGDKMVMLYDYLTGSEFVTQWKTMRESFIAFRSLLQKERDDFERNWKKKNKMLESIITNSMEISGSIEGISGMDTLTWTGLPESSLELD